MLQALSFGSDKIRPALPSQAAPPAPTPPTAKDLASAEFRERCMHGSLEHVHLLAKDGNVNIHELEQASGRSALHKAAYWGHDSTVEFLLSLGLDANLQDHDGDTPLHDACRFGQLNCVKLLMGVTDLTKKNSEGQTPKDIAVEYGKDAVAALL